MFFKPMWPALVCSLVIFLLCLTPAQTLPEVGVVNFDKLVHTAMFAVLTVLLARGFYQQTRFNVLQVHYLLLAALISIAYGGILELLQAVIIVLNRSGDWVDFVFDALGAVLAVSLFKLPKRSYLLH